MLILINIFYCDGSPVSSAVLVWGANFVDQVCGNIETQTIIFKFMKQSQECLDALNILKGIAFSQLMLEDDRVGLCQTRNLDLHQIFCQIDSKGLGKVHCVDLIKFLGVHRIAISEREGEYILYLTGSQHHYMTEQNFQWYISNGQKDLFQSMISSQIHNPGRLTDQLIKNYGEREVGKMIEKQIEFYRTIEQLKDDYIKKHGFSFKNVLNQIDKSKSGRIEARKQLFPIIRLIQFARHFGVDLSADQFEAIGRRMFAKEQSSMSYKELMKAFSPFQPLNFPTYRKQNNFHKAMEHITEEVAKLQINTQSLPFEGTDIRKVKATTGFNKTMENYRNTGMKKDGVSGKYFYDQNYYNQLKQYRTNFFDPNKDVKRKVQNQMIGPQYHDHFFSDYYLYLEERDKLEHYYNKFGKRYTFQNPISKAYDGERA